MAAAAGNAYLDREMAAMAAAAGEGMRVGNNSYFASSGHGGFAQFGQDGAGVVQAVPDVDVVGSLAAAAAAAGGGGAGIGAMAPAAGFVVGYGSAAAGAVVTAAPALPPPQRTGAVDGHPAAPFKGAWTKEEDEILREMVRVHGDRKWAAIARHLTGRIGKQCRERWINHLLPGIKKDVWTEEEDRALIEAHRACGNRWSVIARRLPGRSENSVKNHWNATKRGLNSKRRLKRKNGEQPQGEAAAHGGGVSLLGEYIRSLCPDSDAGSPVASPTPTPMPAAVASSPPSGSHGYDTGLAGANVADGGAGASALGMGMYYHSDPAANMGNADLNVPSVPLVPDFSAAAMPEGRYSYYLPSLAQLNLHYAGLRVPPPLPLPPSFPPRPQVMSAQDVLHAAYANMNLQQYHPFADHHHHHHGNNNTGGAGGYYGYYAGGEHAAAAGPSSAAAAGGGGDAEEMEVVQMASREFAAREYHDVVTLDLTRFE